MPWHNRIASIPKSPVYRVLSALIALYIGYAVYFAQSSFGDGKFGTAFAIVAFLTFSALLWRFFPEILERAGKIFTLKITQRRRLSPAFFMVAAGICLVFLLVDLAAIFPGGVSADSCNEYITTKIIGQQDIVEYHPIGHTLLVWLLLKIVPQYWFIMLVQCVALSAAVGYFLSTVHAWGVSKTALLALEAGFLFSPVVVPSAMFFWKDIAMTIGVVVLAAQCVQIFLSRGEWLLRLRNGVAFGAALAFASLMRHNAMFLTIPCAALAIVFYVKHNWRAVVGAVLMAVILIGVKGPLCKALRMTYPQNTVTESICIPMAILTDMYVRQPDALDEDARAFLRNRYTDEQWALLVPGTYSMKLAAQPGINPWLDESLPGLIPIYKWAAKAFYRVPAEGFFVINELTDLVWGLKDKRETIGVVYNDNTIDIAPANAPEYAEINRIGEKLKSFKDRVGGGIPIFSYLYSNMGPQMLLFLLAMLYALYHSGTRSLLISLPIVCYNLFTMCGLAVNDIRYFHYFFIVGMPLALLMLRRLPQKQS